MNFVTLVFVCISFSWAIALMRIAVLLKADNELLIGKRLLIVTFLKTSAIVMAAVLYLYFNYRI